MSERMDWPTSRGSMAADWAECSPEQRERAAGLFLGLRQLLPETKQTVAVRLWGSIVEAVRTTAVSAMTPEGRERLARITESNSDPEGLAFIAHMDCIAKQAVEEWTRAYREATAGGAR